MSESSGPILVGEGQVRVTGPDGEWLEVGTLDVLNLEPDPEFHRVTEQLATMRDAFTAFSVVIKVAARRMGKVWSLLTGFGSVPAGPPPMEPGMVTWPTRRRRKRRKP